MKQNIRAFQSSLKGKIAIPPSKSHTLRAILFAALGQGCSTIHHFLDSPDTKALLQACHLLGAEIKQYPTFLEIRGIDGSLGKVNDVIHVGNSGIALRFLSAVAALGNYPVVITGDHSIRHQRPMKPLLYALQQLGASAISTKDDGFAPVIIQGPLKGGRVFVNGEDSQPISALLIAGSLAKEPIELVVDNPGEKPWVTFTLKWLESLGISIEHHHFQHYFIQGKSRIRPFQFFVPGDFSSAAFPIVAALVTKSEIQVQNLNNEDFQGDRELIAILQRMGAQILPTEDGFLVKPSEHLEGIAIDVNDFIDGLPILAVLGCYAKGKTFLRNARGARHKESERIRSMAIELKKMGAKIEEQEDGLVIEQSRLKGAVLDGCFDHRVCMALSIAALGCKEESIIATAESIQKTYPTFVSDFQALRANISYDLS